MAARGCSCLSIMRISARRSSVSTSATGTGTTKTDRFTADGAGTTAHLGSRSPQWATRCLPAPLSSTPPILQETARTKIRRPTTSSRRPAGMNLLFSEGALALVSHRPPADLNLLSSEAGALATKCPAARGSVLRAWSVRRSIFLSESLGKPATQFAGFPNLGPWSLAVNQYRYCRNGSRDFKARSYICRSRRNVLVPMATSVISSKMRGGCGSVTDFQ
jgi:hypothetical protein